MESPSRFLRDSISSMISSAGSTASDGSGCFAEKSNSGCELGGSGSGNGFVGDGSGTATCDSFMLAGFGSGPPSAMNLVAYVVIFAFFNCAIKRATVFRSNLQNFVPRHNEGSCPLRPSAFRICQNKHLGFGRADSVPIDAVVFDSLVAAYDRPSTT